MQFTKVVKRKNLYSQIGKILNGVSELSPRQMQIFSILLKVDSEWRPVLDNDIKNILNPIVRKAIMRDTKINKNNLSRYISELKDKGLLIENEQGGYEVKKGLRPVEQDRILNIVFTLIIEDE